MKKAVTFATNGDTAILDAPEDISCAWIAKHIGCEWVEVVRPKKLREGYILVCDEEGLLKDNKINPVASWLYGTEDHGEPIVGNVMIIKEEFGPEGPEFAGMTIEEAEWLVEEYGDFSKVVDWMAKIVKRLHKK